MDVQINAGDTVIFRDKARRIKRGGRALGAATDKGLWVDVSPKGAMPHGLWVRPDEVVEVRPRTLGEKLDSLKRCLLKGEGECKMVSGPSYFKRSANVRRY